MTTAPQTHMLAGATQSQRPTRKPAHVSLRLARDDYDRIRQLARKHSLPYTTFLVDCALGRLDHHETKRDKQIAELTARVERLEQNAW